MELDLAEIAAQSDRDVRAARARLIAAVRQASAGGMTQQQIAAQIGRSQPEVSRLLRFHGATLLGRRLRARLGEGCVLIALSGYGQDSDRERAQVSGFAHYLVKPVEPAQLHALISSTPVDRG